MTEVIFRVEQAPGGRFLARAMGASIFAESESIAELQEEVREAVRFHYHAGRRPDQIRLQYVREEIIHP